MSANRCVSDAKSAMRWVRKHAAELAVAPYNSSIEQFTKKMHELNNSCILVAYDGEPHGFFNSGRKSNATFIDTVNKMDKFLVSLGYLEAPPESSVMK